MKATVENFGMLSHIAFDTEHAALYEGTIKADNHIMTGKKLRKEVHTKKSKKTGNFGKSYTYWYLAEPNSPIFSSLDEFCKYYNIDL